MTNCTQVVSWSHLFSLVRKYSKFSPQRGQTRSSPGNRKREDARRGICKMSARHSFEVGGNRAIHRTPSRPPPPGDVSRGVREVQRGRRRGVDARSINRFGSVSGAVFIPLCPLRALRRFLLSRQSQTYKSEEVSRLSSDDDDDDDDL